MKRLAALATSLLLAGGAAPVTPDDAAGFAWQQAPGATVPLDTLLRDERGRERPLREAFAGRPVILDLGYFHCPALCGVVRADLFNALAGSGLEAGKDYSLVALSIDPDENPADAEAAKAADRGQAPFMAADWRYLTGAASSVAAVERSVGFRARFDAGSKQFLHPAGLVVLTQDGVVSGYLLGVGYTPGDLRAAVLRAGSGGIARAALPVLLLCFHFDETTGRYTLAIEKVLRLMALMTVVTLGGTMVVLHRQGARR